jgi:hypothetical protein
MLIKSDLQRQFFYGRQALRRLIKTAGYIGGDLSCLDILSSPTLNRTRFN